MDVFEVREQLVADYSSFTSSFVEPRNDRIKTLLAKRDELGSQWPQPWLSLNPNFESGGTVDELVASGILHSEAAKIFRAKANQADTGIATPIRFHRHQREAIEAAATGESYVLTTGTGSGCPAAARPAAIGRAGGRRSGRMGPVGRGVRFGARGEARRRRRASGRGRRTKRGQYGAASSRST